MINKQEKIVFLCIVIRIWYQTGGRKIKLAVLHFQFKQLPETDALKHSLVRV